jgi:hypothetical protein
MTRIFQWVMAAFISNVGAVTQLATFHVSSNKDNYH